MTRIYYPHLPPGPALPSIYQTLHWLAFGMHIVSAIISFVAFLYCMFILRLRPEIWKVWIFQVLLIVQVCNCIRFITGIIIIEASVSNPISCRILLYLDHLFVGIPIYLCVYTVLYLQLVVIHKVSTTTRWIRTTLVSACLACSVVPATVYLFMPYRVTGIKDFCKTPMIPGSRQYWSTEMCVFLFAYIPGVVGVFSMIMVSIYIFRTSRRTKNELYYTEYTYGSKGVTGKHRNSITIRRLLISLVWFPLTPIASTWAFAILHSLHYYGQRNYLVGEFLAIGLFTLQSILLAIALVVNPYVLDVVRHRHHRPRLESGVGHTAETSNATTLLHKPDAPSLHTPGFQDTPGPNELAGGLFS